MGRLKPAPTNVALRLAPTNVALRPAPANIPLKKPVLRTVVGAAFRRPDGRSLARAARTVQ